MKSILGSPAGVSVPWRHLFLCVCALFALPLCSQGSDLDDLTISQMYHRTWTAQDGVPDSIWQVTQTSDGFLWLAGPSGLYRFDGIHFKRYPASESGFPSDTISAVFGASDGSLWIGYQFGGVSVYKDGHSTNFSAGAAGLPRGALKSFVERNGTVWAMTTAGLAWFEGHRWTTAGEQIGYGGGSNSLRMTVDQNMNLWVRDRSGTQRVLYAGAKAFKEVALPEYTSFLALGPDDWLAIQTLSGSVDALHRSSDGGFTAHRALGTGDFQNLFRDHSGNLWLISADSGIYRLPARFAKDPSSIDAASLDHFSKADGLTGRYVKQAMEDREGGIWFISDKGIDYFRGVPFHSISLPLAASGIAMGSFRGGILLGFHGNANPAILGGEALRPAYEHPPDPPESVSSIAPGIKDDIWIGGNGHIEHWSGDQKETIPLPESSPGRIRDVQSLSVGPSGEVWASVIGETPLRFQGGQWQRVPQLMKEPARTPLIVLAAPSGAVFLGYEHSTLVRLSAGSVRHFSEKNGLSIGTIAAIIEKNGHIWLGGTKGIALLEGDIVTPIIADGSGPIQNVTGMVERPNGDLWMNTAVGALLVKADELSKARRDRAYSVHVYTLDFLDGFPGTPSPIRPLPTLFECGDGRLLFAANSGLAWLDPDNIPSNPQVPGVSIDQVLVDGKLYRPDGKILLPTKPQDIAVDVAVGSLLVPERTKVRYKLEGFDQDWRDADGNRRINYPRLPPGNYLLKVQALNGDGVPSRIATCSLTIPPTFFQSWRFAALCAVLTIAGLWLAYAARVRYITDQAYRTFQERHDERERIARDLHDSFFQGIQGLLIRFRAAANSLPQTELAKTRLEEILSQSDGVMLEGRELVFELRTGAAALSNIANALRGLGLELEALHGRTFTLTVEGEVRPLALIPGDHLLKIVREALWNAFHHSQAHTIAIHLRFLSNELIVTVVDDGIGIERTILEAGQRGGHWGLPGMRERSEKIQGSLTIDSNQGGGTAVTIAVPAAIIYKAKPPIFPLLSRRRNQDGYRKNDDPSG